MHREASSGLGHILPAEPRAFPDCPDPFPRTYGDPLDVLPAHSVCRHRVFRWGRLRVRAGEQGGRDIVGVGWLGQIVDGTVLYSSDCGRDVAVTGQHHHTGIRSCLVQHLDDVEPISILAEAQVNDGEGGRRAS